MGFTGLYIRRRKERKSIMKIGIFTDSHYSSAEITCGNRYNSASLSKIREAYQSFKRENCDMVVSLGDLIDCENEHDREIKNLVQISRIIKESGIPTVAVMGNHDAFTFTEDEYYDILGRDCRPYSRNIGGKNMVFLDTCYFQDGSRYKPGDSDWTDTYFPDMEGLQREISQMSGDIYIFMHQNIDPSLPEEYRVSNAEAIRHMIERNGNVRGVYQGHYHKGNRLELNGISYVTFQAMCSYEDACYIVDTDADPEG